MLRITHSPASDTPATLVLEGKLLGAWVPELGRVCNELAGSPDGLRLDLSKVSFVDIAGVALLRELIGRGATLGPCSALVSELLHLETKVPGAADEVLSGAEQEKQLLARVRAGDAQACELFVRRHARRVFAVACRFLRNPDDREDAVQDVFLAAFRALHRFGENSTVATWLHRITVNVCLMKLRRRVPIKEVCIDNLLPTFDETGHHRHPVRAWDQDALARLGRAETCAQVRDCIDRLPASYREVLLLRDIEEMDTEETARLLGINTGAVKTRLHRARQALRTLLERFILGEGKHDEHS